MTKNEALLYDFICEMQCNELFIRSSVAFVQAETGLTETQINVALEGLRSWGLISCPSAVF